MPKLYTSDPTLVRPVLRHSGSTYPVVPAAAAVVRDHRPSSTTALASPKSPSLAANDASSITLLGLTSRCTTHDSVSWCRYSSAEPMPSTIWYLASSPPRQLLVCVVQVPIHAAFAHQLVDEQEVVATAAAEAPPDEQHEVPGPESADDPHLRHELVPALRGTFGVGES
jgi:hypothetical protein|uniref:Uncharacterized protein n=1 Tax=Zea mays TaxID=4577 RepID=A0A804LRN6_MAIZE